MLSREENELLTRTGPGTAMGEAMRRYRIPALPAREIAEPDGPPVRVRLLGENLVAFRDSDGRTATLPRASAARAVAVRLDAVLVPRGQRAVARLGDGFSALRISRFVNSVIKVSGGIPFSAMFNARQMHRRVSSNTMTAASSQVS
jgi:hypothetical protein